MNLSNDWMFICGLRSIAWMTLLASLSATGSPVSSLWSKNDLISGGGEAQGRTKKTSNQLIIVPRSWRRLEAASFSIGSEDLHCWARTLYSSVAGGQSGVWSERKGGVIQLTFNGTRADVADLLDGLGRAEDEERELREVEREERHVTLGLKGADPGLDAGTGELPFRLLERRNVLVAGSW